MSAIFTKSSGSRRKVSSDSFLYLLLFRLFIVCGINCRSHESKYFRKQFTCICSWSFFVGFITIPNILWVAILYTIPVFKYLRCELKFVFMYYIYLILGAIFWCGSEMNIFGFKYIERMYVGVKLVGIYLQKIWKSHKHNIIYFNPTKITALFSELFLNLQLINWNRILQKETTWFFQGKSFTGCIFIKKISLKSMASE